MLARIVVMLCGLINGWQAPRLIQPVPGIVQSTSIGRSMRHGDAEGPEELWCERGGRWAGVREDNASPAQLCSPLLCQWVTPWDLTQDRGPVPMHGPGVLEAGPAAPALPCPERDGKRLDGGSGNGWRTGRRKVKQQLFEEEMGNGLRMEPGTRMRPCPCMPGRGQQMWKARSHHLKLIALLETSGQEGPMVWGGTQQRRGCRGKVCVGGCQLPSCCVPFSGLRCLSAWARG